MTDFLSYLYGREIFFGYVLVISGGALLADYALVGILEFVFREDIDKYPLVAQAFDWYKIGSAFLVFFVAMIHAIMSTYSQIKFEFENVKNE